MSGWVYRFRGTRRGTGDTEDKGELTGPLWGLGDKGDKVDRSDKPDKREERININAQYPIPNPRSLIPDPRSPIPTP
ncbi:MAG: hypothetical protein C4323_02430 [Mastigocladus sp. ERB_26_2]